MRNGTAGEVAAAFFCEPDQLQALPIPRTVRARAPRAWDGAEVVAHTDGLIVDAWTAEAVPGPDTTAFWTRRRRAPLVIVTDSPAALATQVEAAGGSWQGHLHRRRGWQPQKGRQSVGERESSSITSARLPGLDRRAVVVCAHLFLDDLPPEGAPARARRLVRFAVDYISWCADHGWAARPSRGSWGAAFLRDDRFWPAARRKVPRCFNQIAREHLPGNHYERLTSEPGAAAAVEVDMAGAHHQSARRARFPDPDTMSKAGGWGSPERRHGCHPGHVNWPAGLRLLDRPGLFRLRMSFPALSDDEVGPPWWPRAGGEAVVVVWSPELPDAIAHGARVLAVVASITSPDECGGLGRFAAWAQDELSRAGEYRRTWLKGVLLAAYGVLAQGSRPPSVVSSTPTRRSTPAAVVIGSDLVDAHVAISWKAVEPGYVNAIARGIVEAETRAELLRAGDTLARGMGRDRMLALYADSVLVGLPVVSGADLDEMAATLAAHAGGAMGSRAGGTDRPAAETGPSGSVIDRAGAAERMGVPDFLAWFRAHRHHGQRPTAADHAEWWAGERLPGIVADLLAGAAERTGPRSPAREAADWRVKQLHLGLAFHVEGSAVHWSSDRADKRPGVPRRGRTPALAVVRAGEGHWLDDP